MTLLWEAGAAQKAMEEAAAAHQVASEGAAARHAGEEAGWRRREAALLHRNHHLEGQLAAESQVGASTLPVALAAPAAEQSLPALLTSSRGIGSLYIPSLPSLAKEIRWLEGTWSSQRVVGWT